MRASPGYEITQWWGVMLRAGSPQAIVGRAHAELRATLNEPKIRDMIGAQGAVAALIERAEFAAFIEAERTRYGDLVKRAKVPVED